MELLRYLLLVGLLHGTCLTMEVQQQLTTEIQPVVKDSCAVPDGFRCKACVDPKIPSKSIEIRPGDLITSATMCLLENNGTEVHVLCTDNGEIVYLNHEDVKPRKKRFGELTFLGAGLGAPLGPVGGAIGAGVGLVGDIFCLFLCDDDDSGPPPNKPPSIDLVSIDGPTPVIAGPNKTSAHVTWSPPAATDPEDGDLQKKVTTSPNYENHDFDEGSYFVSFSVRDSGGLSAFTSLTFQVKVLRCPQPNWPDNGRLICAPLGFIYGSVCHMHCRDGYITDTGSPVMITCMKSSQSAVWDPSTPMTCTPRKCQPVPSIEHGSVSCPGGIDAFYKSMCSIDCHEGYSFRTSGIVMCRADGSWPDPPKCYDTKAPRFETCPHDKNVNIDSKDNTATVSWDIPTGTDNSNSLTIEEQHNHKTGSRFGVGIHTIRYTIEDPSGNRGNLCSFSIYVSTIGCLEPDFGNHMMYTCPDYYRFGADCSLSCRSGYPNVGVDKIQCSNPSNSSPPKLEWIWDSNGMMPECRETACHDLAAPANGALSCSLWDHGNMCQMQCQEGFDVPIIRDGMFVCGKSDGHWRPDENVPDCIKKRHANQMHLQSDLYYYTGQCNSSNQNLDEIKDNFITALTSSKYHEQCVGVPECQAKFVNVTCGPITARRKRDVSLHLLGRRSTSPFAYIVTFDMTIPYHVDAGLSAASVMSANEDILYDMIDAVQVEVDAGKFDIHVGDLHTDSSSLGPGNPELSCPVGTQGNPTSGTCIGCPTGRYFSSETLDCQYCPIDMYQDRSASVNCTTCPENTNTTEHGATSVDRCLGRS